MERYDPLHAPDPKEWLTLDEDERVELVEDYHRRAHISLPNATLHAVAHAIVENQVAFGDDLAVERTLRRLMAEGLDRHDALHAIGVVLVRLLNDTLRDLDAESFPKEQYSRELEQLTAEEWRRSLAEDDEESTEEMRILDDLAASFERLPVEAIEAARGRRSSIVPTFLEVIDGYLTAASKPPVQQALFFIFHLLGEWREKSAYRPLVELLRLPPDELETILGDAKTETSHRVMAQVFDGDPEPLYQVILDPHADEYVRASMCGVVAMVTLRGELPRAEAERFLRACYSDLEPKCECYAWDGWQRAIALLGLAELKPLVRQAFERGYISPSNLGFADFEEDLQRAIKHPAAPWMIEDHYALFDDTVEELSRWAAFSPKSDVERGHHRYWSPDVPAVNPFKGTGRNDPCPCGSGKKFKKCCLNKNEAA
jgi:Protein of unknown function (DUF1186)/SEC-C motif